MQSNAKLNAYHLYSHRHAKTSCTVERYTAVQSGTAVPLSGTERYTAVHGGTRRYIWYSGTSYSAIQSAARIYSCSVAVIIHHRNPKPRQQLEHETTVSVA
eukprot:scaffold31840_cov67-Cyclotella_meneghiniana.AAC.1